MISTPSNTVKIDIDTETGKESNHRYNLNPGNTW